MPLTLQLIAQATNVSTRRIQRELADKGTTFSQVLGDWRHKRPLELLARPDISVLEVSRRL